VAAGQSGGCEPGRCTNEDGIKSQEKGRKEGAKTLKKEPASTVKE
jgi:hypothetical protein